MSIFSSNIELQMYNLVKIQMFFSIHNFLCICKLLTISNYLNFHIMKAFQRTLPPRVILIKLITYLSSEEKKEKIKQIFLYIYFYSLKRSKIYFYHLTNTILFLLSLYLMATVENVIIL